MLYKLCAVITEQDNGTYFADVPDMRYCTTAGIDVEGATEMIKDAAGLCLVVMEDEKDDIPYFRTKAEVEAETPEGIVIEFEIDSDKVRKESDEFYERTELIKSMNTIVKSLSDEEAYEQWISVVPDQADEYDLDDIAVDDELFEEAVNNFKEIMRNYIKHEFCIGTKSY